MLLGNQRFGLANFVVSRGAKICMFAAVGRSCLGSDWDSVDSKSSVDSNGSVDERKLAAPERLVSILSFINELAQLPFE